jgi:hypothetical protein
VKAYVNVLALLRTGSTKFDARVAVDSIGIPCRCRCSTSTNIRTISRPTISTKILFEQTGIESGFCTKTTTTTPTFQCDQAGTQYCILKYMSGWHATSSIPDLNGNYNCETQVSEYLIFDGEI